MTGAPVDTQIIWALFDIVFAEGGRIPFSFILQSDHEKFFMMLWNASIIYAIC
jgi:hypothetical protein